MTRKVSNASPASRGGVWGRRAHKMLYRDHPDGAKKYRHPITGDVFDVDAVLSTAMLDRLNGIPGIDVINVCGGHGLGAVNNSSATFGFITDRAFAIWVVEQLGKTLPQGRAGLQVFHGRWLVTLECCALDKHYNHVAWWNLTVDTLARLVRHYGREQRMVAPANLCIENTVNNEAPREGTYVMDSEDLLGEINLLIRLMAEASEFLERGDVKAAQMVLEVWWMHSIGHPEVEEDRPVYECRVCQDPATKRLLAKMGGARWAMKSPK